MENTIRIECLADHLEVLPTLKGWFEAEWESYYGPGGPGDAQTDLLAYTNRSQLPVGVVAFLDNELCGVAALKAESIATHSHLAPWASAGLVSPVYRRRGIGAELVRALEAVARSLGYARIYCGTSTATQLLESRGWEFIERVEHGGEDLSIYRKAL
jgi:N-acetylglutamate synthase-like GNAT family acetyltransferase